MQTTLAAVDIVAFGQRYRDANAQLGVRKAMYQLLVEAFAMTGLPWWDCHRSDRGDGALIAAPPDVNPDGFLDPLAHHLYALLRQWNRQAVDAERLQLRMAVHHGCIYYDTNGATGHALVHLFRLLDSVAFKKSLATAGAELGMIVSEQLYTGATERGGLVDPAAYQPLRISCKETRARARLWLPPADA